MKRLIRAMSLLLIIGILTGFMAVPASASTATNYIMDIGDTKYLYPNSSKPVVSALWTTSDANAVQIESQNTSYCKIKVVGHSAQDVILRCEYMYQENLSGNISICTDYTEYSITVNSDSVSTESSYTMSISPSIVTVDLAKPEEKAAFQASYTGTIPNEWYFQVPDTPNSIAFYRSDSSYRGSNYEDIEIGAYPYCKEIPFLGTTSLALNFFARTGSASSATLRSSTSIHVNVICSHIRSNDVIKKDATCTEDGLLESYVCTACKRAITVNEAIPAKGHNPGSAATCTKAQICIDCEAVLAPKTTHSYNDWGTTKEAACESYGEERRDCTQCDYFEVRELTPLGHSFGEWSTTKEPTCEASGKARRDCLRCSHYETQDLIPLGHNFGEWSTTKEPTCEASGKVRRDCLRCSHYETQELMPLGHSFGEWFTMKEPTCEASGKARKDCLRCSHYESREITATGHNYAATVTPPTCTKKGYTTHTCSICGDHYTDNHTDMVDHQYISTGTTAPGKETQVCKCGKSRTANIYGWSLFEGKWYYRDNSGELIKNSWRKDSIGWCYLGKDGAMLTNCWATDSSGWCYIGADGYCETNCWKSDSQGWLYLNSEGSMTKNKWVYTDGDWYYLDSDGYMVTNKWVCDSYGWCYIGSNGAMVTNAWVMDSVGWCYIGNDGYAVTNCWKQDSAGWCYLNAEGSITKNQWLLDGGNWYYLDGNGYMVTGEQYINNTWYVFNESGILTA